MAGAGAIRAGRAFVEIFADDSALNKGLKRARSRLQRFARTTANMRGGLSTTFASAKAAVDSLGSSVTALGTQLGLLAGGMGLGFASAFKEFTSFETQMLTVQGILRVTEQDMASVIEKARELGRTTSFSATEVAEGMTELARAGRSTEQIIGDIGPAMDLARGTMVATQDAVKMIVRSLNQFNLAGDQATRVADTLAAGANSATTDITELGLALKFVGPFANELGMTLEEVVGTLDVLADKGLVATVAGTQFSRVLKELTKQGKQDILKNAFKTGVEQGGKFAGLVNVFRAVSVELKKMGDVEGLGKLEELFGRGTNVASIMSKMGTEIEAATLSIINQRGAAEDLRKTIESKLFGAWKKLTSAISDVKIELTTKLAPALMRIMKILKNFANAVSKMVHESDTFARTLFNWSVGLGAFAVGLLTAGAALRTVSNIISGLGALAQLAITPLIVAFKLLAVVVGIALLGAFVAARVALAVFSITLGIVQIAVALSVSVFKAAAAAFTFLANAFATGGAIMLAFAIAVEVLAIAAAFGALTAIASVVVSGLNSIIKGFRLLSSAVTTSMGNIQDTMADVFGGVTFNKGLDRMVNSALMAFQIIKDALTAGDLTAAWEAFIVSAKLLWAQFMVYLTSNGLIEAMSILFVKVVAQIKLAVLNVQQLIVNLGEKLRWFASLLAEVKTLASFLGLGESQEDTTARLSDEADFIARKADLIIAAAKAEKQAAKDAKDLQDKALADAKTHAAGLLAIAKDLADKKAALEQKRAKEAIEEEKKRAADRARLIAGQKQAFGTARIAVGGGGGDNESGGTFSGRLARQIFAASKSSTLEGLAEEGNELAAETNRILRNGGISVGMA